LTAQGPEEIAKIEEIIQKVEVVKGASQRFVEAWRSRK
jgi:hypothetical protein